MLRHVHMAAAVGLLWYEALFSYLVLDLLEQHLVLVREGEQRCEHGAEGEEHQLKEEQPCIEST